MKEICGCCEGIEKLTPFTIFNRPGLKALVYRVGTHATFLETMLARLSEFFFEFDESTVLNGSSLLYPLRELRTRDPEDPAIALLDGWATVVDVLTFYQERIANEGYLRTATERRSILELARLVGYKLRSGVAATAYLAFELEKNQNIVIPKGVRAQSIPGPGEFPQAFETSEPMEARFVWNALKPRLTRPNVITLGNVKKIDTLYFKGISTNLKQNDLLLLVFGFDLKQQVPYIVNSVELQSEDNCTKVTLPTPSFTLNEALSQVVETYSDLKEFGVNINAPVVKEVVDMFTQLKNNPVSGFWGLCPISTKLRSKYDYAVINALFPTVTWLRGMITEIGKILIQNQPPLSYFITETYIDKNREIILNVSLNNAENSSIKNEVADILNDIKDNLPRIVLYQELSDLLSTAQKKLELQRDRAWGEEEIDLGDKIDYIITENSDPNNPQIPDIIKKLNAAQACLKMGDTTAFSKLQELVSPLLRPPSLQPINPLRRPISVERSFSDQSDIGPQLLVFQRPELKDTLYNAWRNAVIAPPLGLQSIETFRVKAATFGHNAPLKPILDNQGRVVGYDEWPLAMAMTPIINIVLFSQDGKGIIEAINSGTIDIIVSIKKDAKTASSQKHVKVNDSIVVDLEGLDRITIEFILQKPDLKNLIRLTFDTGRSYSIEAEGVNLKVTIDQINERIIFKDELLYYLIGECKGTISFGAMLSITDGLTPTSLALNVLALDMTYERITPGSWVVIKRPDLEFTKTIIIIARVEAVQTVSKADYGITGKVTQITLSRDWLFDSDLTLAVVRRTEVYAQSESLELTEEPVEFDVEGDSIELNDLYDGLKAGRWLVVSGERTDITTEEGSDKVKASEVVMLLGATQKANPAVPGDSPHTNLDLANSLAYRYKRDTVTINANVAHATQGETRTEVLGSGDSSQVFQKFMLKQWPLTYLSAATQDGIVSTLEVRVNNVLWRETDHLSDLSPVDRQYITATDNESKTSIIFGNGERGARLPTGIENIKVVYRSGIGKSGNVAAQQISLLATRPLGVKGVINPLAASGGADREAPDQARQNTPIHLKALDRAVSIQDYADFARAFAGISKAHAVRLSNGRQELVHLTIAGTDNIPIDKGSDQYYNLQQALYLFGDPYQPMQIDLRELMIIILSAQVSLLPEYQWETVEPQIRAALLECFGFNKRELGQDVLLSEAITTIQTVPGVDYVDIDVFDALSENFVYNENFANLANILKRALTRIPVNLAHVDSAGRIRPCQLAIISPEVPDSLLLKERSR